MARFVGKLNFGPLDEDNPKADRVLEQNFGFVRDDGIMILMLAGCAVNGASTPECLWQLLGHPLEGRNAWWSTPHDGGYRNSSFVLLIDLRAAECEPELMLDQWDTLPVQFLLHRRMPRKWWDKTMLQCMKVMHERRWKRGMVYAGVRLGGWRAYQN